jgi:hypothetical protein
MNNTPPSQRLSAPRTSVVFLDHDRRWRRRDALAVRVSDWRIGAVMIRGDHRGNR